jgi:hypothetical protein
MVIACIICILVVILAFLVKLTTEIEYIDLDFESGWDWLLKRWWLIGIAAVSVGAVWTGRDRLSSWIVHPPSLPGMALEYWLYGIVAFPVLALVIGLFKWYPKHTVWIVFTILIACIIGPAAWRSVNELRFSSWSNRGPGNEVALTPQWKFCVNEPGDREGKPMNAQIFVMTDSLMEFDKWHLATHKACRRKPAIQRGLCDPRFAVGSIVGKLAKAWLSRNRHCSGNIQGKDHSSIHFNIEANYDDGGRPRRTIFEWNKAEDATRGKWSDDGGQSGTWHLEQFRELFEGWMVTENGEKRSMWLRPVQ